MTESELSDKPVLITVLEESAIRSSALASSLRLLNMLVESARSVVKGTESQRRFNVQFAEFCRSALLAREAWEHAIANSSYIAKRIADNKEGVDNKPVETSKNANKLELLEEDTSLPTNSSTITTSVEPDDCTTLPNNYDKWEKQISYYKKHGVSETAMLKEIASYVASQTPHLGRRYVEHIALGVLHKSKRTETPAHNTTSSNTHSEYSKKKSELQSPQPTLHSSSLLEEHATTHANRHDASRRENDKQSEHYIGRRRERERERSISSDNNEIEHGKASKTSLCGTRNEHAKKKNAFEKCTGNVFDSDRPTNASISHFLSSDDRVQASMPERAGHTSFFDLDQLGELDEEVTHRAALGIVMEEAKKTAMANIHSNVMSSPLPSSLLESKSTPSQTKTAYSNTPINLTRPTVHQSRRAAAKDDISITREESKVEEGVFVSHYKREARSSETRGNKKMELSHTSHASRLPHQLYDLRDPAQKLSAIPELCYRVQPWAAQVPSLAGVALDRVVLDKMERRSKMPLSTSPPSRFPVESGSDIRPRHCRLPQASESVNKNVDCSDGAESTNNINTTNKRLSHNKESQQQQQMNKKEETEQRKLQPERSVQQKEERVNLVNELQQQYHERKIIDDIDVPTLYEISSMEQPTELLHAWERRESARAKFWNNALQSATHTQLADKETRKQSIDNRTMHTNDIKSSAQLEHNARELPEQVDTSVETKNVNHKSKVASGALPADAFFLSRNVKENISMPWSLMINHIHYGLSHLELPYAKREREKL